MTELSSAVEVASDPLHLRRVFGAFPSGVTALAALVDGAPIGLTASSFTSVSLDPALVSVCITRGSWSWARLASVSAIGISVLGHHQEHVGRALATPPADRFAGVELRPALSGALFVAGAAAWLETRVAQLIPAGDHDIAVLEVLDLDADAAVEPLVFHGSRFRRLA